MATQPGLEVEVGITLNRLVRQLAAAEARMTKTAQKMEGDFSRSAKKIDRGFTSVGRSSGQTNMMLRNTAFQLNQVAQQGAITGDYMRALSFQLPDIAMGFGAIGAAIGIAAGVLGPIAIDMLRAGEEAQTLEDTLEALATSVDDYVEAVKRATASDADLAEIFGRYVAQARELLVVRQQLAEQAARDAQRGAVSALAGEFGGDALITEIDAYIAALDRLGSASGTGRGLDTLQGRVDQVMRLREELNLTVDQALEFNAALIDLQGAASLADQADAAERLVALLGQAGATTSEATEEARAFLTALVDATLEGLELEAAMERANAAAEGVGEAAASINFDGAITGAKILAQQLGVSLSTARAIAAQLSSNAESAAILPGPAGGGGMITVPEEERFRPPTLGVVSRAEVDRREAAAARVASGRSGGGGGGGVSEEQRQLNELMREGARLTEEMRTQAEEYADEMERLNALLAAGAINQETFDRAAADLRDRFSELGGEMEAVGRQISEGIGQAFADAITEGENFRESMSRLFRQIANDLIASGLTQAMSSVFSGGGSGALLSGIGASLPGFATGGTVAAGRPVMVGEHGPEPFVPAVNGRILSVAQAQQALSGSMGGGGGVQVNFAPVIDARGADTAAVARIDANMRQLAAELPGRVHQILREGRNRRTDRSWRG